MAGPQGRTGKVFLKKEAVYGTEESLAATNALRHINVDFTHRPFERVNSPEKNASPGQFTRFDRKPSTGLGTLVSLVRPSGTLNTLPEIDPILEAAFGAVTNVTLNTTVASAPTANGATLTSAAGLAVGDAVLLTVTGQAASPFVRFLDTVSGADVTWSPALPAAQTVGDAVKGGITYKLTTPLAISLTIAHYLSNFKRELLGAGIDTLALAFDANAEPQATASGPAKDQLTGTTQAEPGAFTTVGGNPPSGIKDGDTYIDDTVYLMKSLGINLTNSLAVRNTEYGVQLPTEMYRNGVREIGVTLDAWAETEATLYDKTEAGTLVSVFNQTGRTEGNIVAAYMPRVDFAPASQDDPDGEVNWSFAGVALESALGANDELRLALM